MNRHSGSGCVAHADKAIAIRATKRRQGDDVRNDGSSGWFSVKEGRKGKASPAFHAGDASVEEDAAWTAVLGEGRFGRGAVVLVLILG